MDEQKKSVFAKHLRELRARLRLTQKEFSKRVGITPATLSAYESGTKNPPVTTAIRIAEEYEVSLDWLCGIHAGDNPTGYRVSYEEGLKHFVYILKTFCAVEFNGYDYGSGPDNDIWGSIDIKNLEMSNFLKTIKSLIELNENGALDDFMLEACVEKACSNAAPKIYDETFKDCPI